MGQATSRRALQQGAEHYSDTASADMTHHAMSKQQWELQMKARLRALQSELRTLIEEGTQPSFLRLSDTSRCACSVEPGSNARLCSSVSSGHLSVS